MKAERKELAQWIADSLFCFLMDGYAEGRPKLRAEVWRRIDRELKTLEMTRCEYFKDREAEDGGHETE